jgi:hypothetical protein
MKTLNRPWLLPMLTIAFSLLFPLRSIAQSISDVPHTISYQGQITNLSGVPLEGTQSFTLRLYSDAAGTQVVWEDTYSFDVLNGAVQFILGNQKQLPHISTSLWLGITAKLIRTNIRQYFPVPTKYPF